MVQAVLPDGGESHCSHRYCVGRRIHSRCATNVSEVPSATRFVTPIVSIVHFVSEMKQNLRELCIPLEEYAYDQEYACALLLGLLDPLIKKHSIDLQAAQEIPQTTPEKLMEQSLTNQEPDADIHVLEQQPTNSNDPIYGQIINRKVHELWNHCEQECNAKLKEKIREKKNQISAKANSARRLRRYAIESIVQR